MNNQTRGISEETSSTGKLHWMETVYSNLHNKVLGECQVNMLRALIDEVGPSQALEAV